MKIWKVMLAMLLVAAYPLSATAQGLSYNYFEAGYARWNPETSGFDFDGINVDFGNSDPDGYYLNGRRELSNKVFVQFGYSDLEDSFSFNISGSDLPNIEGKVKAGIKRFNIGIGHKTYYGNDSIIYISADAIWEEYDVRGSVDLSEYGIGSISLKELGLEDWDESGFRFALGYRSNLTERFELYGEISGEFIDDDSVAELLIGGLFHVTDNIGFTVKGTTNSDSGSNVAVGVRITY